MPSRTRLFAIPLLFLVWLLGIISLQYAYDLHRAQTIDIDILPSPSLVRMTDLGLHSALSTYWWLFSVRTQLMEIAILKDAATEQEFNIFFKGLSLVNSLDSRFSAPYVFSLLVLPETSYAQKIPAAISIGLQGLRDGDANWQIPLNLAIIYFLNTHDFVRAAYYFDLASRTPGIPEIVRRFAINYGIPRRVRATTETAWRTLYAQATTPAFKERAKTYLDHLALFDALDKAVAEYHTRFGAYPKEPADLVAAHIISQLPEDPFGFTYQIYGSEIGVSQLNLSASSSPSR